MLAWFWWPNGNPEARRASDEHNDNGRSRQADGGQRVAGAAMSSDRDGCWVAAEHYAELGIMQRIFSSIGIIAFCTGNSPVERRT